MPKKIDYMKRAQKRVWILHKKKKMRLFKQYWGKPSEGCSYMIEWSISLHKLIARSLRYEHMFNKLMRMIDKNRRPPTKNDELKTYYSSLNSEEEWRQFKKDLEL